MPLSLAIFLSADFHRPVPRGLFLTRCSPLAIFKKNLMKQLDKIPLYVRKLFVKFKFYKKIIRLVLKCILFKLLKRKHHTKAKNKYSLPNSICIIVLLPKISLLSLTQVSKVDLRNYSTLRKRRTYGILHDTF